MGDHDALHFHKCQPENAKKACSLDRSTNYVRYIHIGLHMITNFRIITSLAVCLFAGTLSGFAVTSPAGTQASPKRPNIILFMVDDMGWQDTSLPFWRETDGSPKPTFLNKRYRTPNMENLANQGMMFTNAYAQPICSPSRVSLMSGMNAARHRVTNWTLHKDQSTDGSHPSLKAPEDWNVNGLQPVGTKSSGTMKQPLTEQETPYKMNKPFVTALGLPALLKQQGYTTIHCGKAHFGSKNTPGANPKLFGFDYNIAGTEIGGPADYRGAQRYGSGAFQVKGLDENNYYENDVFLTEALTQEAMKRLDSIRNNPKEANKPFYLYMSHYAIHVPIDARGYDKRFADKYSNPNDGHPWSDNEKRYSGLIEGMDKSLGDIQQYLKKHNLDQNTVIIFMSDNGGLAITGRTGNKDANYPLGFGKGSTREGGIREPMIVCWPGVTKEASVCTTPVIIEDFFPSILEIAGAKKLKTPQTIDGKSFVPLLKGVQKKNNRPLLFHSPNIWIDAKSNDQLYAPSTAMIQDGWKLIYRHPTQQFDLFNITEDIGEGNNLTAKYPDRVKLMAKTMTALLKDRRALMPTYKKDNVMGAKEGSTVPWPDQAAAKL